MNLNCDVLECVQMNDHTYKVILRSQKCISFKAGQYLFYVLNDDDKRPFSIANTPDSQLLELHIGASKHSDFALKVVEHIKIRQKKKQKVKVEVGHGNAWLRDDSKRPKLLIAGGTGFSYIKSLLEQVIENNPDDTIFVYWGAKTLKDLYYHNHILELKKRYKNFNYEAVIEVEDKNWKGREGNVLDIVKF